MDMTDEMLINQLDLRVKFETENEAEIIDFIREVMARNLFLKLGANSMFDFLTRARYSYVPSVAQRKLDAAKFMQAFPEIKEWMSDGELNLSQLGMFAKALRQRPASEQVQRVILETMRNQTLANSEIIVCQMLEIKIKAKTKVTVQRDGSVRVELTFSKEDWADIQHGKEVLSHEIPNGELTRVLADCVRFTIRKKDPASGSRREVKPRQSARVSRQSRRWVFRRDHSCRHKYPDGSVCGSRYQLQVDHILARHLGGGDELENLQLLCGVHNRFKYEGEIASEASAPAPEPSERRSKSQPFAWTGRPCAEQVHL